MRSSFRAGAARAGSRRLVAGAVTTGMAAVAIGGLATPAAAVPNPLSYEQFAYATSASQGGVVTSTPSSATGINCTTVPGLMRTSDGAVSIPGMLTAGTTSQAATTSETGPNNAQVAVTRSTLTNVSVLGGIVELTDVGVTSTAVNTGSGITASGAVTVGGLTVLGVAIPLGDVAPNTVVPIPLLGSITLNEQAVDGNGIRTIGLHVSITAGPNAGLDLTLGFTQSRFLPKPPVFMTGVAYSNLIAAGPLSVNPLIAQGVPCNGGSSAGSLAGVNLPGILNTGAITAAGAAELGDRPFGASLVRTGSVDVLSGLITADGIRVQVGASKPQGSPPTINSTGTSFAGLRVLGVPVPADVAANTLIPLPGVGYVVVNRQIATATSLEIRALEVVVQVAGVLPVGSVIRVAVASLQASDQAVIRLAPLTDPKADDPTGGYADELRGVRGPGHLPGVAKDL